MSKMPKLELFQRVKLRNNDIALVVICEYDSREVALSVEGKYIWVSTPDDTYHNSGYAIVEIHKQAHPAALLCKPLSHEMDEHTLLWKEDSPAMNQIRELEETVRSAQEQIAKLKESYT